MAKSVVLFGAEWCPFCVAVKTWLEKNNVSFEYKDADSDGVRDEMKKYVPDNETIPVVVVDGKGYVNPELKHLAELVGVEDKTDSIVHDVIGGLAAITDQVDNYPGFPDGVTGMDLAESLEKQAVRFGTKFEYAEVTAIENRDGHKRVITSGGEMFAKAVLVATGSDFSFSY